MSSFERYDYEDLSIIVVNDIIKKLMKINIKNIDSIINEIRETCMMVGFLGVVCSACKLIDMLYDRIKKSDNNLINKIKNYGIIFNKVIAMRKNSISRISAILANDLVQDSHLVISSMTLSIIEIISGVQFRVEKVYVPAKEPFGSGRTIAEELRRRQVRSYQLPDSHLLWAIQNSHAIVGSIIGSTDRGRLIVEAGFETMASMASSLGLKVYLAQPLMSLCPYGEDLLRTFLPGFIVTNKQGLSIRLRSIDVIDPEDYNIYIVNENEVERATKDLVKERQASLASVFSDTLNYLAIRP